MLLHECIIRHVGWVEVSCRQLGIRAAFVGAIRAIPATVEQEEVMWDYDPRSLKAMGG